MDIRTGVQGHEMGKQEVGQAGENDGNVGHGVLRPWCEGPGIAGSCSSRIMAVRAMGRRVRS